MLKENKKVKQEEDILFLKKVRGKLKKNREYKYKDICFLLDEEIKTGNPRLYQLIKWKRFFEWNNPTTQKFTIEKIYRKPKEKIDKRKNNKGNLENLETGRLKRKELNINNYKVSKEDEDFIGVYCFKYKNLIYIGSTINSFRKRYFEHLSGFKNNNNNTKSSEIIKNKDYTFETLIVYKINTSINKVSEDLEKEIREKESELIKEYKYNKDEYICVNSNDDTFSFYGKTHKFKNKQNSKLIKENNKLIKKYRKKIKDLQKENKKLLTL